MVFIEVVIFYNPSERLLEKNILIAVLISLFRSGITQNIYYKYFWGKVKRAKLTILISLVLLLTGCFPKVNFMKYVESSYDKTTKVEVFRNKTIEKDYIEIGELSIKILKGVFYNNENDVVIRLKEKAKEIGADAIIILGKETKINSIKYEDDEDLDIDKNTYLNAIAIKYIN